MAFAPQSMHPFRPPQFIRLVSSGDKSEGSKVTSQVNQKEDISAANLDPLPLSQAVVLDFNTNTPINDTSFEESMGRLRRHFLSMA